MELQTDSDLYAIIKMLPVFGKHHNLAWAYIELFGITPMRPKTKKIRILLEEMKALFDAQAFNYQKKQYQITQAGIAEALNVVIHRHFADRLESHNYLKKIMIGISEREAGTAGREAEKSLRKKEDGLRHPHSRPYEIPEEQVEPPVRAESFTPEQIAANKLRIKDLLKSMG